jgi:hypothetical protein
VFPKTLRNMWAIVSFFNPMIALLLICIIPLAEVGEHKESLLAFRTNNRRILASLSYFNWCSFSSMWSCFNIIRRSFGFIESYDIRQNITKLLLKQNKRGSNYRIIISFLIMCFLYLLRYYI